MLYINLIISIISICIFNNKLFTMGIKIIKIA